MLNLIQHLSTKNLLRTEIPAQGRNEGFTEKDREYCDIVFSIFLSSRRRRDL